MGSNQSKPAAASLTTSGTSTTKPDDPQPVAASTNNKKESTKQRTGVDLVNHKCRKKKAAYDKCVSQWYRERFLAGKSINQEEECGELFDTYKQCYMKHLKREFFDKGEKKVKDGSMLAEELDE